ncbi:MAG: hypothetical protein JXA19_00245 [Anaerolineales bacterium]|nr:hypothetical protein [Anaerolineales bacterium]
MKGIRRIWTELSSLILSVVLAMAVWVSAVVSEDPNIEKLYPNSIPLQIKGLAEDKVLLNDLPGSVRVELRAPDSIWEVLTTEGNLLKAEVDLTGLENGPHDLPIKVTSSLSPVQVLDILPGTITADIEDKSVRRVYIQAKVDGIPALGFSAEDPQLSQDYILLTGGATLIDSIATVEINVDITGLRSTFEEELIPSAYNENGKVVEGVYFDPETIMVTVPIVQAGGYRDVAVAVSTVGQLSNGYRVTNISVSPPTVTVYSSDPDLVADLPGYVRTAPLDLSNHSDDIEINLPLDLPDGVAMVSEDGSDRSVSVFVGVAAIVNSQPATVDIAIEGLNPGLEVTISPEQVDIILSGPIPALETITPEDLYLYVDLSEFSIPGVYSVKPIAEIFNDSVTIDSVLPSIIEVEISYVDGWTPVPTNSPQSGD